MPAASCQAKYSRRLYRLGCEKTALSKRKGENSLRLTGQKDRKTDQRNLYYQWQEDIYKINNTFCKKKEKHCLTEQKKIYFRETSLKEKY